MSFCSNLENVEIQKLLWNYSRNIKRLSPVRTKKTWREIVEKDCRARGLNREDAMDRARWRKLIGMIDDYDESSG